MPLTAGYTTPDASTAYLLQAVLTQLMRLSASWQKSERTTPMPDNPTMIEFCVHVSLTDHRGVPQRFSMQIPAVSKQAAEEAARITIKRRSPMPPREIHYIQA